METNNQSHKPQGFMESITARVIMVGVLTLILLIPLQFVKSLIWEREALQDNVKKEINGQYGGEVYLYGPVLKIPYLSAGQIAYAYYFPETLNIKSDVKTEEKNRNVYKTTVFKSVIQCNGYYKPIMQHKHEIDPQILQWDKATILVTTKNLKTIKGAFSISINGRSYPFEPTVKEPGTMAFESLETQPISINPNASVQYSINVNYDGSERISVIPIGKLTDIKMKSDWPDPKFTGNFLPVSKQIDTSGFAANWKVSHLNRPFVQQYFGSLPDLKAYALTTEFLIKNNEYQQNERTAKYGFLVIGLTFLVFFLIQTISKIFIHIFQYTMIGLALIMFYTLLVSITEHSSFNLAYSIAGTAVVSMITLYTAAMLKNRKLTLLVGASLATLYTFIYVIIKLEDYALLAGSIGLFAILAAVMYFSRKIEWQPVQ